MFGLEALFQKADPSPRFPVVFVQYILSNSELASLSDCANQRPLTIIGYTVGTQHPHTRT